MATAAAEPKNSRLDLRMTSVRSAKLKGLLVLTALPFPNGPLPI